MAAFIKGNDAKDEATELARCTLYNLSSNAANRPRLFGAGDHKKLDALLSGGATPTAKEWAALLRDPKATSGDNEGAAEALYNLSFVEASREALLAEGVDTQLAALRVDEHATPHAREWAGMAWRHLNPLKVDFLDLMDAGVHEHLRACLSDGVTQKATEYAARALSNLSRNESDCQKLIAEGVIEKSDALPIDPLASPRAKKRAAKALMLSIKPDNHQDLVDAGVHNQLVALLSGDPDDKATEYAAKALMKLFKTANHPALVDSGFHKQLVALLSSNATGKAKQFVAGALCNLSFNTANHPALVDAGVYEQLGALLSGGATDKAKEYAAGALCNLSFNTANHPALFAAGVHEQLGALLSGGATDKAKEYAAGALNNLGDAQ